MKNRNLKRIAFTAIAGLFLTACGGGGGSSSSGTVTVFVPSCGTAADLGKSVAVDVTGKTIQKTVLGSEVRIWHSSDARKKACMIKGQAEII